MGAARPIPSHEERRQGGAGASFWADERRGDRRKSDRRAPHRTLDALFAMTLINQVKPAAEETLPRLPYSAAACAAHGRIDLSA
jgi:hypothetical protein